MERLRIAHIMDLWLMRGSYAGKCILQPLLAYDATRRRGCSLRHMRRWKDVQGPHYMWARNQMCDEEQVLQAVLANVNLYQPKFSHGMGLQGSNIWNKYLSTHLLLPNSSGPQPLLYAGLAETVFLCAKTIRFLVSPINSCFRLSMSNLEHV